MCTSIEGPCTSNEQINDIVKKWHSRRSLLDVFRFIELFVIICYNTEGAYHVMTT